MEISLETQSADETRRLGERLADLLEPGDIVLLTGDLGAGKTTLVQGVARGLEIHEQITSPTFVIVREYRGRMSLYHVDAYRLENPAELSELGYEKFWHLPGAVFVEWGEKVMRFFEPDLLRVNLLLGNGDDERRVSLCPVGDRWREKLARLERTAE